MGVPLIKVRNVLRSWRYGASRDPREIAGRKDVMLDPRTVMVLLEELRDRSLIGIEGEDTAHPHDGLTEAGKALAGASGQRRTPKERAGRLVADLLERSRQINARTDLPFSVQEIWLFGSMIDPSRADVADIDIAIRFGRPEAFETTFFERFRDLALEMGGRSAVDAGGVLGLIRPEMYVVNQLLFGGHKRLFSVGTIEELQDLACPCRMIFDAARGGAVDDPVLPRHPKSAGRAAHIGEQRSLPDLFALRQPIQPIAADLTDSERYYGDEQIAVGPWSADDPRARLLADAPRSISVLKGAGLPERIKPNVVTKRFRPAGLDQRNRAAVLISEPVYPDPAQPWQTALMPNIGLVLSRSFVEEVDTVTYRVEVLEAVHKGVSIDFLSACKAVWWIYLLASTDLERLIRRDMEGESERRPAMSLSAPFAHEAAGALAELSQQELSDLVNQTRKRVLALRDGG